MSSPMPSPMPSPMRPCLCPMPSCPLQCPLLCPLQCPLLCPMLLSYSPPMLALPPAAGGYGGFKLVTRTTLLAAVPVHCRALAPPRRAAVRSSLARSLRSLLALRSLSSRSLLAAHAHSRGTACPARSSAGSPSGTWRRSSAYARSTRGSSATTPRPPRRRRRPRHELHVRLVNQPTRGAVQECLYRYSSSRPCSRPHCRRRRRHCPRRRHGRPQQRSWSCEP